MVDSTSYAALGLVWAVPDATILRPAATHPVESTIQIDNHHVSPAGPDEAARPSQLLTPPLAAKSARDGGEANARQAAALTFGSLVLGTKYEGVIGYANVYPRTHPGSQARLGWTLSNGSTDDLDAQMRNENRTTIANIKSWFSAPLLPSGPSGWGLKWCPTATGQHGHAG
jgi:hypothetical protein